MDMSYVNLYTCCSEDYTVWHVNSSAVQWLDVLVCSSTCLLTLLPACLQVICTTQPIASTCDDSGTMCVVHDTKYGHVYMERGQRPGVCVGSGGEWGGGGCVHVCVDVGMGVAM